MSKAILLENYIPFPPLSANEKKQASNTFWASVRGGKNIIDITALHKAYDEDFELMNLLDLFTDDGTLADRSHQAVLKIYRLSSSAPWKMALSKYASLADLSKMNNITEINLIKKSGASSNAPSAQTQPQTPVAHTPVPTPRSTSVLVNDYSDKQLSDFVKNWFQGDLSAIFNKYCEVADLSADALIAETAVCHDHTISSNDPILVLVCDEGVYTRLIITVGEKTKDYDYPKESLMVATIVPEEYDYEHIQLAENGAEKLTTLTLDKWKQCIAQGLTRATNSIILNSQHKANEHQLSKAVSSESNLFDLVTRGNLPYFIRAALNGLLSGTIRGLIGTHDPETYNAIDLFITLEGGPNTLKYSYKSGLAYSTDSGTSWHHINDSAPNWPAEFDQAKEASIALSIHYTTSNKEIPNKLLGGAPANATLHCCSGIITDLNEFSPEIYANLNIPKKPGSNTPVLSYDYFTHVQDWSILEDSEKDWRATAAYIPASRMNFYIDAAGMPIDLVSTKNSVLFSTVSIN